MNFKFIYLVAPSIDIFLFCCFLVFLIVCHTYKALELKSFFSLLFEEVNHQSSVLIFYLLRLQTLTWKVSFISIFCASFVQVLLVVHNNFYPQISFSFIAMYLFSAKLKSTILIYNHIFKNGLPVDSSSLLGYAHQYDIHYKILKEIHSSYVSVTPISSSVYPGFFIFSITMLVLCFTYREIYRDDRSKVVLAVNIDFEIKYFFPVLLFTIYLGINFFFKIYFVSLFLNYFNKLNLAQKIKFLQGLYYLILVNFVLNFLLVVVFFWSLFYFGFVCPVDLSNLSDVSQNLLNLIEDLTQAIAKLQANSEVNSFNYEYLTNLSDHLQTLKESQILLQKNVQLEFKKDFLYFPYQYFSVARQALLCFFGLSWVILYVYVKIKPTKS